MPSRGQRNHGKLVKRQSGQSINSWQMKKRGAPNMLGTYDRYMKEWRGRTDGPQVTRTGGYTYDHRHPVDRLKELEAEVEALRARVKELERNGMKEVE